MKKYLFDNFDEVSELMPTRRQYDILKVIQRMGRVCSTDIANNFDIDTANAATQLKRLYTMGWLKREDICCPSGGILYEYKCNF